MGLVEELGLRRWRWYQQWLHLKVLIHYSSVSHVIESHCMRDRVLVARKLVEELKKLSHVRDAISLSPSHRKP